MATTLESKREKLLATIRSYGRCAVAYSGGVDSAVVAKAAALALGENAIAVTGASHSLAAGELEQARQTAGLIGIRHHVVSTAEFDNSEYVRNAPDRCFHCKTELYSRLAELAPILRFDVIVNGANVDDLGDYRPGLQAAADFQVHSPLAECGLHKSEVRELAKEWGLPVWDKPATPCLSSRVAYGEEVTPERLRMIDKAERYLRDQGFQPVRVRFHGGDLARVEVAQDAIPRLLAPAAQNPLVAHLKKLGFRFVTIDLDGFHSGSLNRMVDVQQLRDSADQNT